MKMKAIISTGYGAPGVLQLNEVEKPQAKENEVLIRVHSASVTRADGMMRTGKPYFGRLFTGISKPKNKIPGTGFAGNIEAVGKNVQRFQVGDAVFGESIEGFGSYAEYLCIPQDGVISKKPVNMTFQEAATVCDGPLTSMNFLKEIAKIKPGQKVLINGASGSLGTSAVQLAKLFGAEVTGVCSAKNLDMVKSLGADYVIDYTRDDFTSNGQTYDVIYDTVGKSSFSKCKAALTKDGAFVSPVLGIGLLLQMISTYLAGKLPGRKKHRKVLFSATGLLPVKKLRELLEEIVVLIDKGGLRSVIDREYPMGQIADAHRYVDAGHKKGNVVINMG